MSTPTVRTELAAAVRCVAAAHDRLPDDLRPDVGWAEVDDLLEDAVASGDREQAMAAINEWKQRHLEMFERACS